MNSNSKLNLRKRKDDEQTLKLVLARIENKNRLLAPSPDIFKWQARCVVLIINGLINLLKATEERGLITSQREEDAALCVFKDGARRRHFQNFHHPPQKLLPRTLLAGSSLVFSERKDRSTDGVRVLLPPPTPEPPRDPGELPPFFEFLTLLFW